MHPVFERRSNLLLYLTAWLPPAALFALLLAYAGQFSWSEAFLIAAPMAAVCAFLCLSAWAWARDRAGARRCGCATACRAGQRGLSFRNWATAPGLPWCKSITLCSGNC